jgi:hypothetical protein
MALGMCTQDKTSPGKEPDKADDFFTRPGH